jgi:hypothetical protein
MRIANLLASSLAAALLMAPLAARAQAAPAPEPVPAAAAVPADGPVLFHWPVGEAQPGRKGLTLSARWEGTWNGRALRLHWRHGDTGEWHTADFQAARNGIWEARIPAGEAKGPTLAYWIESVEADGSGRARFASAEAPHVARLAGDAKEERLKVRLEGHNGHRHRFDATFTRVDFGQRRAGDPRSVDHFNQLEFGYTFRPLAAGLYHVQVGALLVGDRLGVRSEGTTGNGRPGAYLGVMKLYWEFGDVFGLEPQFLFGASQWGVEAGGGITFRFGSLRGTHFDLAFSGVRSLGWRFETELDVRAAKFLRVALRNEITTWPGNLPSDAEYGIVPAVRLAFLLPWGIELTGQVNYGIRKGYRQGWVGGAGGVAFEF